MKMLTNTELEAAGLSTPQMQAYHQDKAIQDANLKADPARTYTKQECNSDIDKMQVIIDNVATAPDVKDIAKAVKRILKYIKPELD